MEDGESMKFVLYGFGGSYNHGGEAIIQTTSKLIRELDKDAKIILSTHFKEQDLEFSLPVEQYCERDIKALEQKKSSEEVYAELINEIDKDSVVISIGADNYCYDNWRKWIPIHEKAKEAGAKTIFWSSSIEPDMIEDEMLEHLKTFDLITVRESITYDVLKKGGLTNIKKCYEVAFALDKKEIPLPDGFEENNTIALNVSPLVLRREKTEGIILRNIYDCIEDILSSTNHKILLIPHVLSSMDNDVDALRVIKEHYKTEDRIIFLEENYSASEYKYIISKCRFGIFARTHASIASYSSFVPTIVMGYSVKSAGIAKDLGMEEYLLPIEKLEDGALLDCFRKLRVNEENVRSQLENKKEEMSSGVRAGYDALKELVG